MADTASGLCTDEEHDGARTAAFNKCIRTATEQFVTPRLEETKRCSLLVLNTVKNLTEKLKDIDPRLVDCFGATLGKVKNSNITSNGLHELKQFDCLLPLELGKNDKLFQVTTFAEDISLPDHCAVYKTKCCAADVTDHDQISSWLEFVDDKGYLIPEKLNRLLYEGIENALMIFGDEFDNVTLVEAPSGIVTLKIKDGDSSVSVKLVTSVVCYGLPPGVRTPIKWPNHPHAKGKSKVFVKSVRESINAGTSMWCLVGREFILGNKRVCKPPSEELASSLWYVSMATLAERFAMGAKDAGGLEEMQVETTRCRQLALALFQTLREGQETSLVHLTDQHLKTLLLWEYNRYGNWSADTLGDRFLSMLRRLRDDLKLNTLQDFFYVDINMFADLSMHLRRTMHDAVRKMLKNIYFEPENILYYMSPQAKS